MDIVKTGEFIAKLRKEKGLTQEQFGDKMGVTNKTVSRWETGKYLPPADVLLLMSELFDVSINELLTGQRLTDMEYKQTAEKNLTEVIRSSSFTIKDEINFFKKKWLKDHIFYLILIGICILGVLVAGIIFQNPILCSVSVILLLLGHIWRNNSMMAYVEKHIYDK